jgi:hypothetical protein
MLCCVTFTVWCPGGRVQHGANFTIFLVQPSLARNRCIAYDILVYLCGNSAGPKISANHQDPVRSHGPAHWRPIHHLVRTRKDLVWAGFKTLSGRKICRSDAHHTRARYNDPYDHRGDEHQLDHPRLFSLVRKRALQNLWHDSDFK